MRDFLGIDTSNYTTSCAIFRADTGELFQQKKLLPVKKGELGIRQSDAVFHHTKQLPELMESLKKQTGVMSLCAITASNAPRTLAGSYMPCFTVGETCARTLGAVTNCETYFTSHQIGHVLAALYSADMLKLIHSDKPFLAFHVSGGTTDLLLCTPDAEMVLDVKEIASSLDLKAGQAVDRVGLMLGLSFPCGKELEKLADNADKHYKCKAVLKDMNCCLSGLENRCKKLLDDGETKENIAAYCIDFICETVRSMTEKALERYPDSYVIYAGGVMSNIIIRNRLSKSFRAGFAEPELSCDNAAGVAIYGAIRKGLV